MLFSLKQVHVLLMLVGGIFLVAGLVAPWFFLSVDDEYYSMSAFGGLLVDELAPGFFNSLVAYFSLCFAVVAVLLSFVSARLSEVSERKYVAVVSCFAGICALMNIVYLHSWLGLTFPGTPFVCSGSESSCGPLIGYFLTWVAAAFLFASTYVSKGLTQMSVKTAE